MMLMLRLFLIRPCKQRLDWTVSHHQNKLSRHHKPTLDNLLRELSAKAYWVDHRKQLTTPAFDEVDWTITCDAVCSLLISRHHWLTKRVTGVCGVGKMQKFFGKQTHAN
jgi:hypothetical protein